MSTPLLSIITAFTADGKSEAEIATPTSDPIFLLRRAIARAAPEGMAVKIPMTSE